MLAQRANACMPKDGSEGLTAPLRTQSYTVAMLPTASLYEGGMVYVSNESGGAILAFSDGTTGVASATEPSSVKIVEVPRNWVLPVWTLLQRSFRRAQRSALGDRMDEAGIVKGLTDGSKVLLVAVDNEVLGGVVLEFMQRPKGKACIVVVSLFNEFHDRDFPQWSGQ